MKKVAVVICGQYREFDIAFRSWKFLNLPLDFDIYLSTWDTSYEELYDTFNTPAGPIETITIDRILKTVPNIKDYKLSTEPVPRINTIHKFEYHIKTGLQLMIDSNIEYDYVMIIRTDMWLTNGIRFDQILLADSLPDDEVYGPSKLMFDEPYHAPWLIDCFLIGNYKTMKKFIKLSLRPDDDFGSERMFGDFYVAENLRAVPIPGMYELLGVRSNSRDLPRFTETAIRKKTKEWWNLKHPENAVEPNSVKKVAVLICGQYREFETAVKSWKFMPPGMEYDMYMSTWNTTYEELYDGEWTPATDIEEVTTERIRKIIGLKDCKTFTEISGPTLNRFVFLIKAGINMMIDSGIDYEYVIIIRPDLWVVDSMISGITEIFKEPIPDNVSYGTGLLMNDVNNLPRVMDCIWIANQLTIEKFLEFPDNNPNYGMESLLGSFYTTNKIEARLIPNEWEIAIVRSNCKDLPEFTEEAIRKKSIEWYHLKHPESIIL